jgi:hypothetical protein
MNDPSGPPTSRRHDPGYMSCFFELEAIPLAIAYRQQTPGLSVRPKFGADFI